MVFSPTNAFAESVMTTITCADAEGNQREFQVGWDNTHQYFANPEITNIPAHYCEGGYAGVYIIYVTDGLAPDNPVRWYNGIAPIPTPEPSPTPTVEPSPEPTVEPSPTPTETVTEPTPSPSQLDVVPVPEPEPTVIAPNLEPDLVPEVVQESVQVEPEPSPTPIVTPTPEIVPEETPEPQPTIAIAAPVSDTEEFLAQISIQLPVYLENIPGAVQIAAAAEAIMAIGSDMTPEEREESQGVVVAAVIVGQLAQVRRLK